MNKTKWPSVSIVTPTLNSGRTIELYFQAIATQKYAGKVEVVIADGGSADITLQTAKKYHAKVISNKLKTAEAGKAAGAKDSSGEIIAFIDSDNILPDPNWLTELVTPFIEQPKIVASEPLYFTYRRSDHWLTRYFALLGMGDPLTLFIGNYDRYSFISDKWTGMNIQTEDKGDYLMLFLKDQVPTIGANGFLIRKSALKKYPIKDYLFDIDVLKFLAEEEPVLVAKVKTGIVHLFAGNISTFIRKQRRRFRDLIYFQKQALRASDQHKGRLIFGVGIFILSCLTLVPLLLQMLIGFMRKPDPAWLFHPVACWITLITYGTEAVRSLFSVAEFDRRKWSQ